MSRKKKQRQKTPQEWQQEQKQQRLELTILFSGVVIAVLVATILVVGGALLLLTWTGILTELEENILDGPLLIILIIGASLLIGTILAVWLGKIPLKPVNKMINQMNRLASGDFKARISFGGPFGRQPTVVELTDSFNKMAEELENTEMLRVDFINNFSHEFKTPIVSIAGFAKLLKRGNLTEQQRMEYLNIIEEESLRLSYMATNVLNLTKVENQTILTEVTGYNLSEQLRSSILLLESKWEKKNLDFDLEFGEYMIEANEELLKQVWINLLDNAIKFSSDSNLIEVDIKENDRTLSVSILNSGSEIAPEHQKKIFNKFYQADESHSVEGNGIGLAVVRHIVELHKGTVSVRSESGITRFTVELPKKQERV
ncbi:MAG: HAMP domain-containing histidine kinase [Lachnospiraceae bacterium]|nr:HAMP domain-containing histidine kinase [Lachnospiraceae bacterium]